MSAPGNKVLSKMLDRLLAGLMSGPNMNCRPHKSRQRVDLTQLIKLQDISAEEILAGLLGPDKCSKTLAKVKLPKKSENESPQQKAWLDQSALLTKLRLIADDARTYENDTGVHALSIGFPILSLPPGSFAGNSRNSTKRILAPIAFIPVNVQLKGGSAPSVEITCRGEGADRVTPNTALINWIEQQTGKPQSADLFEDEEGADPVREIAELVAHVANAMNLQVPYILQTSLSGRPEGAPVDTTLAVIEPQPDSKLILQPAPRGDDDTVEPTILLSAVLGLFPTAHQGLLRDTRAMLEDECPLVGPIQSFLTSGIDFDEPATPAIVAPTEIAKRLIATERLATAADPCQAQAVTLARKAAGLVIHGPPGTGKSQTITNIIADHLARGQRVLFVCEKRTALDVVADRLDHMGLRPLCGIVHDPQKDQRDLYRSIHQQLDDLPDAKTNSSAERQLQKVDAEMQQLHDELTGFHKLLMEPIEGAPSFHELMGRWMSFRSDYNVKIDAIEITANELEANQTALLDLLNRATAADFTKNPWTKCVGISLVDFLSRPMADFRTAIDRVMSAAESADATADLRILPFTDHAPIANQAAARAEIAVELTELFPHVLTTGLASLPIKEAKQHRAKIDDSKSDIALFRAGPLDLQMTPSISIKQDLLSLQRYLDIAEKWFSTFAFRIKSEAAGVLKKQGLTLAVENAKRLKKYLLAVQSRSNLSNLIGKTASDEQIEEYLQSAQRWFPLLERIDTDPALEGVGIAISKLHAACGFADAATTENPNTPTSDFLDGLKRSSDRADAIHRLEESLTAAALFSQDWQIDFSVALRHGKLAHDTAAALSDYLDYLEGVLRIRQARTTFSPQFIPVVDQLLGQVAAPEEAMAALQQTVLTQEITVRLRSAPTLQSFDAHHIESNFDRYRQLDQQKKKLVHEMISHLWVSKQKGRLLNTTGSRLNSVGADLRRRLTSRGERAMRLRQVISIGQQIEGGDPLFDLCPVWMASPETVAQIFPREALFDVVIFDEASQCRLEEALPVLTRGRRVVIAGDPQQLPPTRFFESAVMQSNDEEPETEQELFETQQGEVEDLLAAALNLAIQQCYLDVHYRSRNSDLIEFSNRNFYSSRLQAIPGHPSHRSKFPPLTLYRVDGAYNKRANEAEADRVVQIVHDLLNRAVPPSIGIACLNLPQRDLIMEKLDDLASQDADFAKKLATARARKGQGSFEGLFVKNLENVQGDERDDIIISTTYGPDIKGKFYRRFGPLGMAGGGRRLNVLVTRARNEVHLVTSIPVDSYRNLPAIPQGQSATGAWLLFAYLKYAEELATTYGKKNPNVELSTSNVQHQTEEMVNVLPSKSPSLFAGKLAEALAKGSKIGSDVHWGNEGFCVDLALHHPTRPGDVTIGVLCDGCRYTAADDAVEWDIFRTGILASQGWNLRRIWTPHFFRDPLGNIESLHKAADQFVAAEIRAGGLLPQMKSDERR